MEIISTIPMRCIDMLISHRRKYKNYAIFSGVDDQGRDFDGFYTKVVQALDLLPTELDCGIDLMGLVPKRIIGTVFHTQFWQHPKSLEINYDRTFDYPSSFVAGEILFEVLREHFSGREGENESIKKAGEIEREYIKSLLKDNLAREGYEKYYVERPANKLQKRRFMRKLMRERNQNAKKWFQRQKAKNKGE